MPSMEITTVIGCKNACVYCPQQKLLEAYAKRSHSIAMTFHAFKTCVNKIPQDVGINFSGMSEPWLNPDCTRMLLYAHLRGHRIRVFTTLVGMRVSDIDAMVRIPFEDFIVHLPSVGTEEQIRVDRGYLAVLEMISKSPIQVVYIFHGESVHPEVKDVLERNAKTFRQVPLITRAGNLEGKFSSPYWSGVIACYRGLRQNVLLPNGDVVLCCMDYGLEHVLGNLLESDYVSLFGGKEFTRVKRGLRDEDPGILCRSCDGFAYRVTGHYWSQLKGVHSLSDAYRLFRKGFLKLGGALHLNQGKV